VKKVWRTKSHRRGWRERRIERSEVGTPLSTQKEVRCKALPRRPWRHPRQFVFGGDNARLLPKTSGADVPTELSILLILYDLTASNLLIELMY